MSEKEEVKEKKKLGLSRPGRLELKKTVDAGQVRQNFSHGRSKSVAVEVRRRRTFKQDSSGVMQEVRSRAHEEAEQAVSVEAAQAAEEAPAPEVPLEPEALPTLTEEERAARARALSGAKQAAVEEAERERVRREEEAEEARRREQEDAQRQEETTAVKADAAVAAAADVMEAAAPVVTEEAPAPQPKAAPAKAREAEAEAEDESRVRRPGKSDNKRLTPRRGEQRRRSGKLTIAQALDDEERIRSLASLRRSRERERRASQNRDEGAKIFREVVVPETITVQELANRMAERAGDVIKSLMKMGVMATITQSIDADTAELVVSEFGHRIRRVSEADVEIGFIGEEDASEALRPRAPIVTVMGHVDHGKTSLLDALRSTDVVSGEAGGITQHIGAYQVNLAGGQRITFLDTPGHEAFTAMRARGANVTDLVILVVAGDDGIMPQTVEAIDHARAAEVPIIVAINKMDRPDADATRVRNELLQHELVVEELGGDVLAVEVSATQKTNLDRLEEAILLQAELLELKANPNRSADGVVVEAKLDRGRGVVSTLLVQRGTLRVGDIVVAGSEWGRVRALISDTGGALESAGPAVPVEVLGMSGAPAAGDTFAVVENEARARELTEFRRRQARDKRTTVSAPTSLDQIFSSIKEGETRQLPVVIKGDVQGSVEAIEASMEKLATDEVSVRILHSGVGGINESDVTLAKASNALILGFNVRANPQAREMATGEKIDIRYYSVIYQLIDDMKALLGGLLKPMARENFLGYATIQEVFNITRVGKVAGCRVTNGVVKRGSHVRLLRDDVVIHEGRLGTLKRFKEEVREVREGYECGLALENYQDIKSNDVIECFEIEEVARTL